MNAPRLRQSCSSVHSTTRHSPIIATLYSLHHRPSYRIRRASRPQRSTVTHPSFYTKFLLVNSFDLLPMLWHSLFYFHTTLTTPSNDNTIVEKALVETVPVLPSGPYQTQNNTLKAILSIRSNDTIEKTQWIHV